MSPFTVIVAVFVTISALKLVLSIVCAFAPAVNRKRRKMPVIVFIAFPAKERAIAHNDLSKIGNFRRRDPETFFKKSTKGAGAFKTKKETDFCYGVLLGL